MNAVPFWHGVLNGAAFWPCALAADVSPRTLAADTSTPLPTSLSILASSMCNALHATSSGGVSPCRLAADAPHRYSTIPRNENRHF